MIDLNMAKRLKVAGYEHQCWELILSCNIEISEKDLMEWLANNMPYFKIKKLSRWYISQDGHVGISVSHSDITECLVQAVEAVLKGRGVNVRS